MNENRTPTNIRALLILEVIAKAGRPLTPTEINTAMDLPKQSIHRLCHALVDLGFLTRDHTGKRLMPSARARSFGTQLAHGQSSDIARHQVLRTVATSVQETVNFAVPQRTGMHYADRVETDWPFRIQLPIGTDVPFHCTASGKVYLASLPKAQRRAIVYSQTLDPKTDATITDPEAFLEELAKVRRQGHALDLEEFMVGMVAVAVPVYDPAQNYVASLAFHGPTQRLDPETLLARKPELSAGAARLTEVLFSD